MNPNSSGPAGAEDLPQIQTQADLEEVWRLLMGDLGFGGRTLWLQLIDAENQLSSTLLRVEDLPEFPEPGTLNNFAWICLQMLLDAAPGGSAAVLITRPGTAQRTPSDRAWATGILEAAAEAFLPCRPIHLANDQGLRVFAADDLGLPETG